MNTFYDNVVYCLCAHAVFNNSLFQLHLSGAIVCNEWVVSKSSIHTLLLLSKLLMAALRLQTRQVILLEIICSCGFSDKYIRGMRLVCRNDNSAGQVIFLARIISFDGLGEGEGLGPDEGLGPVEGLGLDEGPGQGEGPGPGE